MSRPVILLVLLVAAFLESGGDALMRKALHASTTSARSVFYLLAALVLFGYIYVVNAPPWDFGRLLGVYVVCFFVAAQMIAYLAFWHNTKPNNIVGRMLHRRRRCNHVLQHFKLNRPVLSNLDVAVPAGFCDQN